MIKIYKFAFLYVALATIVGSASFAAEILENKSDQKIEKFSLKTKHLEVITEKDKETKSFVILEGIFSKSNRWSLSVNGNPIARDKDGSFRFKALMIGNSTPVDFLAKSPSGKIFHKKIIIKMDQSVVVEKKEVAPEGVVKPKRVFASAGLGISAISFKETGMNDYSSTGLTAKANINYLLIPPAWEVGVSAYATALHFSKTPNVNVHFFGFNARFGYILQSIPSPWRLTIYGGFYYTTMFVANNAFGFKNLEGPQIYPEVRRLLFNGDTMVAYAKYSPVSNKFSILSLSSREIAFGGAYLHPLSNGHPISVTLDYSNTMLSADFVNIQSNSITVGLGYGF